MKFPVCLFDISVGISACRRDPQAMLMCLRGSESVPSYGYGNNSGLRYLFSRSQRRIAFCRQVKRVALGDSCFSYSISRSTTDLSPPTFLSRSSNNAASLSAPVNNSSAICGSPRTFLTTDSIHWENRLFGRCDGCTSSASVSTGSTRYTPQLGHFNRS